MKTGKLQEIARELAARDGNRGDRRKKAHDLAVNLRDEIVDAVEVFTRTVEEEGAPYLDLIRVSTVKPDDKSVRAFQIRVSRGRFHALVVSKDRGEVMLVGPFKAGRQEEPCQSFHLDEGQQDGPDLSAGLESLLSSLIRDSYQK